MRPSGVPAIIAGLGLVISSISAIAQEPVPPTPAGSSGQLPPVEVIQKKATPAPKTAKKSAPKKKTVSPAPQPPAIAEVPSEDPNPIYGSTASAGAAARATDSATTPVNPTTLVPSKLQGFSSAATIVSKETLTERQPENVNEALTRVPGITVINDDGAAHHGGIGIRGAPPRRSRKMLVMEDGHTVNLALWLDPSVHYWAPLDRIESIEVLRGTVITHGPNNNFGVINSRNLSPFGLDETVISAAIGWTKTGGGCFEGEDENGDDVERCKGDDIDTSGRWHVHTRQHSDNVGLVASYTGESIQGAWDTERLRVHDFYGALGWKGSGSDLVVSVIHARQDDNYDEQNFLGGFEVDAGSEDEAAAAAAGIAESQFHGVGHCKECYAPSSGLNTYTGEIWRGQIVHNAYLDDDTTITSRFYAGYHRRDRYQLVSPLSMPDGSAGGEEPEFETNDDDPSLDNLEFGLHSMFGRLLEFRHVGGEVRGELANQNVLGFRNDLQAGVRYEYQDMSNMNVMGNEHEILEDGDNGAATFFDRSLRANTVSAFLQSNVHVARNFNVVPGVRFEWYDVDRQNRVVAAEEGEAEGEDDGLEIENIDLSPDPARDSTSSFNALPGVAFAYTGLYRSTVFGGYHRGLTTNVLRNEDFPSPDEIGDNFNVGLRSSAIKGFNFEVVGFYHLFEDFQFGESFSSITGDREFGRADEAEVKGVELFGRLNSQPFTGGPFNFFGEANYTYQRGTLEKAFTYEDDGVTIDDDYSGNRIPETPWHVAALTLGVEKKTGWRWDASVTWTYRGEFFTDAANTPYGFGFEIEPEDPGEFEIEEAGEGGGVPSVWLLSARFNLDIGDTGASVFVSGYNLLDELYITDREDGMKPGLGRTVWTGFKYKY
jgi:Fe(3+) dicitrate transport protein